MRHGLPCRPPPGTFALRIYRLHSFVQTAWRDRVSVREVYLRFRLPGVRIVCHLCEHLGIAPICLLDHRIGGTALGGVSAKLVWIVARIHTLSPQMVIRDHVRILWKIFMAVFHVSVSDMLRTKFEFWMILGRVLRPGTWKFKVVDLNR